MRGVAAILVVTVHATGITGGLDHDGHLPLGGLWVFGRSGVDFFFVLSGFIITYIHFGDIGCPGIFSSFWFKRLLRIYPAYWIVAALFGLLLFISPTPDRAEQSFVHAVLSFLLLPEQADPVLGVGWSLRHELLFYAIFSLALLHRRLGMAVFFVWAAAILWNMAVQLATGTPYFHGIAGTIVLRGFNIEFFFGIAAALLLRANVVWCPGLLAVAGAAGFIATGMWESFGQPVMHEWPVRHLMYATSAALVLYGAATLDRTARIRVPAFALRLGAASYSIYLVHMPVILVLEYFMRGVRRKIPMPVDLVFLALVVAAIVAGVIFSEIIEQPLLRWGRSAYGRRATSTAALAPAA